MCAGHGETVLNGTLVVLERVWGVLKKKWVRDFSLDKGDISRSL